jgi:hypothetical protein
MRQKTINLRHQGSFDNKIDFFFPDPKSHTQMGSLRAKNASEKFSRLGTCNLDCLKIFNLRPRPWPLEFLLAIHSGRTKTLNNGIGGFFKSKFHLRFSIQQRVWLCIVIFDFFYPYITIYLLIYILYYQSISNKSTEIIQYTLKAPSPLHLCQGRGNL